MIAPILVWFRRDLRLSDHTALNAALDLSAPVLPAFIFDPALLRGPHFSPARLAFLLAGLESLDQRLREFGSRLIVRTGEPAHVLRALVDETNADAVHASRDVSPFAITRDARAAEALAVPLRLFDDALLQPPEAISKADGGSFTVFTPFSRAWSALPAPAPDERRLRADHFADSSAIPCEAIPSLTDLGYSNAVRLPKAGEAAARRLLTDFTAGPIFEYSDGRNVLGGPAWAEGNAGTSALSPYLRFGMLSPRQALAAAQSARSKAASAEARNSAYSWVNELAWREFYANILFHFPQVLKGTFKPQYAAMDWRHSVGELERWKAGLTGYPVVDAAMRQLVATGWMHNRARMVVASFLSKDLLHYWAEGEAFFMQHLLDGDPASNNGGWQWTAGTGTDAQPFFRIFNPLLQSQRYDPNGDYIRAWVPELRGTPTESIHAPWQMANPPRDYPAPLVDHYFARDRALAALASVKGNA
ncbi:MAG TPA: deoxyribodipyrimidine photo-lyase [Candidatus Limnocylindrales bacterium]|nr:deoxyribodipyrimidine photo-lyase [Candidatus Limnocylindrales bacterium]